MTQPQNLDARVTALEGKVTALQTAVTANTTALGQLQTAVTSIQSAFSQAVVRLTALEESLAAGQPRLAALEEAARGFESRVKTLEGLAHAPSNADAARIGAVETALAALTESVSRLSQVARPGRSVVREQLTDLQAQMTEVLSRLPAGTNGTTTPK